MRAKQLAKENEQLLEEKGKLISQIEQLRETKIRLMRALRCLLPRCPSCKMPASQWKWNSKKYIMICTNKGCINREKPVPGGMTLAEFNRISALANRQ